MTTNTNTTDRIDMSATIDRRIAALRADAARPVIMPDRPTDTSRNHQRGPKPSPKRRIIR